MNALELLRIELTVSDTGAAEGFYTGALGFTVEERGEAEPAMAALLGGGSVRQARLRRGGQTVLLQQFEHPGRAYPADASACDGVFQHFAMPVADMAAAFARLQPYGVAPVSHGGPQVLPQRSGGAVAFKFRDPDGHPLELIQFPDRAEGGIDHSAIAVADAERSIAFYCGKLGMRLGPRQVNAGPEQDRLDGLPGARVDVVALLPHCATPHVELLGYQSPAGRPAARLLPNDVAATRLVFAASGIPQPSIPLADGRQCVMLRDPDGHLVLMESA